MAKNESNNTDNQNFKPYPKDNAGLRKLIDNAWKEAEDAAAKYRQNAWDKSLFFAKIDPLIIEYHITLVNNNILAYRHDKVIEIRTFDKFFGIREYSEPKIFKRLKNPNFTFSFN